MSVKDSNRAHEKRSLRVWRNEHTGVATVSIELNLEEGALFEQAVEKASVRLSAEGSTYQQVDRKDTPWSAVQADAAMMIVREYLTGSSRSSKASNEPASKSAADHYQVVVHVDEKALSIGATDGTVENKGASELPIETVRRLCCDGSIVPIVENSKGEPLSVGRKVRTVTTAICRALWARDKGCAWPGCHCRRFVDAHQIKHWADGGDTSVSNILLLCTRHHQLVHEGGYTISLDHNHRHYFRRPDGKAIPHSGYSLDDWQDDYSGNVSFEQLVDDARARKNSREFFQHDNQVSEGGGCYHLH